MNINKNLFKKILWVVTIIFVLMNIVAIFHSYKFTHFSYSKIEKTKDPIELNIFQKIQALVFGVNNPRPKNKVYPKNDYSIIKLKSNKEIECWEIRTDNPKGTVALFHGFSSNKSSLIDKSEVFLELGYNTLLVDFMGTGGSEGNQTTIGFLEAKQVKTCINYLSENGENNIYLYGSSMGAVAIMKSINDYKLNPNGIIVETPFATMYETVCSRFEIMNVPSFPMASFLVFWGGIINGFWGFEHNSIEYAKNINCPTLLLYGGKDKKVNKQEIEGIYKNIKGKKNLKIYKNAGHENLLLKYKKEWKKDVKEFLSS